MVYVFTYLHDMIYSSLPCSLWWRAEQNNFVPLFRNMLFRNKPAVPEQTVPEQANPVVPEQVVPEQAVGSVLSQLVSYSGIFYIQLGSTEVVW